MFGYGRPAARLLTMKPEDVTEKDARAAFLPYLRPDGECRGVCSSRGPSMYWRKWDGSTCRVPPTASPHNVCNAKLARLPITLGRPIHARSIPDADNAGLVHSGDTGTMMPDMSLRGSTGRASPQRLVPRNPIADTDEPARPGGRRAQLDEGSRVDAEGVEDTAGRLGDDNPQGPAGRAGGGSCPAESYLEGGGRMSLDEEEIPSDESAREAPEGQMERRLDVLD